MYPNEQGRAGNGGRLAIAGPAACQANVNSAHSCRVHGVGAGAVDPEGIGEGASLEPCVLGGFLFADAFFPDGVGDGLAIADAVVLVPVVPDCWQDAKNAMPIRTAIKENTCFFIGIFPDRAGQRVWLPIVIESSAVR